MTQPASPSDESVTPTHRDLIHLGAASMGVPLITPARTHPASGGQPAQVNPEAAQ